MLDYTEYLKIFVSLLAIVNPLGAIPVYIAMTSYQSRDQRRITSNHVAEGVAGILLATLLIGETLLNLFGISINSFRVGGGILILLMAISMLQAKTSAMRQTDEEANESLHKESIAVVPLAMPLIAGPGAIGTIILATHKSDSVLHYVILGAGILALSAIIWITLRLSPLIESRVSATGINVFTRIMGLILAAVAIEFIANGVKGLFPVLA